MLFILKILVLLFLVLANGFFVASEFAIVKIRETRVAELSRAGNLRARVARTLIQNLDAYLSACQLGITMASLGLGWLGEPFLSEQLKPLLRAAGVESEAVVSSVSITAGFVVITFLHIVFGELAPKSLAIRRTEGTALWSAIPLRLFYWTFFPAIWVLNEAAVGFLRILGIEPAADEELAHSEAELKMLLALSARSGHISEKEKRISERALRLADLKARQVMIPRNEIVFLSLSLSLSENLSRARRHNFSRYPLCETGLDKVTGMLHLRDLLWMVAEQKEPDLRSLAREILFVSEEENLEVVLEKFRSSHIHMALVVDEVGSVSGLVTLEDVLEQLVGPIQDEFDRETPWLKPLGPGAYEASGRTPLTVLRSRLDLELEDSEVSTLSGYLTEKLGRFPREGDELRAGPWKIKVLKTDALKARLCLLQKEEE